jgi:hypothetical protein
MRRQEAFYLIILSTAKIYSIGDRYTELLWNDNGLEKLKQSQENPTQCRFFYHKYHMKWPGTEPRPLQ